MGTHWKDRTNCIQKKILIRVHKNKIMLEDQYEDRFTTVDFNKHESDHWALSWWLQLSKKLYIITIYLHSEQPSYVINWEFFLSEDDLI
jgi:hypothetical protein